MSDLQFLIKYLKTKPVTLIGMMAAGKTVTAMRLAKKIQRKHYDSDAEIEKYTGAKISDIFQQQGEKKFREYESEIIEKLLNEKNIIISLGGGACLEQDTRVQLKKKAYNIWLDVELDVIVQRAQKASHRPLLQNGDVKEKLQNIMRQRNHFYQQTAQLKVSFQPTMSSQEYADKIITEIISQAKDNDLQS